MIMSFILPTIRPYPFSSMTAVSPVWNHRSGVITSSVFALGIQNKCNFYPNYPSILNILLIKSN